MHLLILMILMSFGTCKVVPKKADPIDESFEMLPYPYHPWDWYTYLHEWLIFMVNVGRYTIHGCYGICSLMGPKSLLWAHFFKPSYYRYGPEYAGKNSVTTRNFDRNVSLSAFKTMGCSHGVDSTVPIKLDD